MIWFFGHPGFFVILLAGFFFFFREGPLSFVERDKKGLV
jgi:hypothetical protein